MNYVKLNVKQIVEENPQLRDLSDGEQTHLNHATCEAGRDTKKRLFVKRDGGTWIAYCHHCQGRGAWSDGQRSHIRKRHNKVVQSDHVHLPPDCATDITECHPKMNVWLNQYGITMAERRQHGIAWSDRKQRCILPVYMHGKLVAYQERRILDHDTMPKYLTTRAGGIKHPLFSAGITPFGGTLVITEDILSAIKVGRQANTEALLGTYLPDDQLSYLMRRKPSKVLIWLDDDCPEVKRQQRRLMRRLGAFVETHKVTGHKQDPKAMTDDEIKEVLDVYAYTSNEGTD